MTNIESITLEVADVEAARRFYTAAFDLDDAIGLRASDAPTSGFRGFTLSLSVSGPANVDSFFDTAVEAGATVLKPAAKSLWGYGVVVEAPDGTVWQIVTSQKKDTGPATRKVDSIVLMLGVSDMPESKRFYVDHGLTVAKSYGKKYTEFEATPGATSLALYPQKGITKLVGVKAVGTGSHRLVVHGGTEAFTDPDRFEWEPAANADGS
ncbi:glyoxalase [Glycomyces tarimensis]